MRNDRGDRGDVGIIRSPVRATVLPDHHQAETPADNVAVILESVLRASRLPRANIPRRLQPVIGSSQHQPMTKSHSEPLATAMLRKSKVDLCIKCHERPRLGALSRCKQSLKADADASLNHRQQPGSTAPAPATTTMRSIQELSPDRQPRRALGHMWRRPAGGAP